MKCVINGSGDVKRVTDEKAHKLVDGGTFQFCPKWLWKKQNKKK